MADPSLSTIIGINNVVNDLAHELDPSINGLYRRLDRVRSRIAIFPSHCRRAIEFESEEHLVLFDFNFYQDTRRWWKIDEELNLVVEVNWRSEDGDPNDELAWNMDVHEPVLHAALDERKDVSFFLISAVRMSPTDILSPYGVSSEDLAASPVHYVICIQPTDLMEDRLDKAISNEEDRFFTIDRHRSINPTRYELLRKKPIGITIQTSPSPTPHFPLWTAAQFTRMKQLFPNAPLPTLPAIVVSGTAWELYFVAPPRGDAEKSVRVYKDDRVLGDTASVEGTYQLLASLRRLADWVGGDLRAWWEDKLPMAVDRAALTDMAYKEEFGDSDADSDGEDSDEDEGVVEEDEDEGEDGDEDVDEDLHDYEDDEYVG